MMDKNKKLGAGKKDIDKFTRLGSEELKNGHLQKALECFELAFKRAQQTQDDYTERVCAFNFGAVYIALRKAERGLELLHRAVPPVDQRDGKSNGDLFYNFGLGYEILKRGSDAVKYLELALEEYQLERGNLEMEAQVACKLGALYLTLASPLQAARSFAIAGSAYGKQQATGQQAHSLCQQACSLHKGKREVDALQIADDCMLVCQKVPSGDILGKLYNDLGLLYTQLADYRKAAAVFELALPLSRGSHGDKHRQSVILQNLGAVYNSTGDYQRSLQFHESAAALHAELSNRSAQGQCFANLAFAQSRLGDFESAGECYLHALQAAKDTGDTHAQWQAMEGLGAVAFQNGNVQRAIHYYNSAIATLAASREPNVKAQDRLVGKLKDALQTQVMHDQGASDIGVNGEWRRKASDAGVKLMLNDHVRPPTRQEQREWRELRKLRTERLVEGKKIPSEFETIALGLGTYDSDSDLSAVKNRHRPSALVRRRQSPRPASAAGKDEVDLNRSGSQRVQDQRRTASEGEDKRRTYHKRSLSRRQSNLPATDLNGRRRGNVRPLLRGEDYDSEEEWQRVMKSHKLHVDAKEHRERLHPPSTPETDEDLYGRRHTIESKAHRRVRSERLKQIPIKYQRSLSEESIVDDVQFARAAEPVGGRDRPGSAVPGSEASSSRRSRSTVSRSRSSPRERGLRNDVEEEEEVELNDTSRKLGAYEEKLRRMEEEYESRTITGSEESICSTGSETEMGTEDDEPLHTAPPPPQQHLVAPARQALVGTYEKPSVPASDSPDNNPRATTVRPGKNYFRMDRQMYEHHVKGRAGRATTTSDPTGCSDPEATKQSVRSEDGLYMSIKSIQTLRQSEEEQEQPGYSRDLPPTLPPRRSEPSTPPSLQGMTRAQEEAFLANYQRMHDEISKDGNMETNSLADEDVPLPQRAKGKNKSKACVVM